MSAPSVSSGSEDQTSAPSVSLPPPKACCPGANCTMLASISWARAAWQAADAQCPSVLQKEAQHIQQFQTYLERSGMEAAATCPYVYKQHSTKRWGPPEPQPWESQVLSSRSTCLLAGSLSLLFDIGCWQLNLCAFSSLLLL